MVFQLDRERETEGERQREKRRESELEREREREGITSKLGGLSAAVIFLQPPSGVYRLNKLSTEFLQETFDLRERSTICIAHPSLIVSLST